MKKNLFAALTLILTFNYSIGQDTLSSSLLWEISGDKVQSPAYLFGSMHMMPKEDFYFPESLSDKVKSSDVLVMEIGGISEQMKGMQLMMLDSGNLYDYFTEPQLDTLFNYTEKHLDYTEDQMRAMFGKMKPFVLLQLFSKESFGENPESYELTLEKIAKESEIEVKGLETIEEQMGFIDNMSNEDQVEMIMSTMREGGTDNNEIEKLIEIYKGQDIEKIHQYITESELSSGKFEDNFLNNRNKDWIPSIRKIIKKKKAFIAVGAGHLGGPNGVLQLLRDAGYTVKPVKL